MKKLATIGAAVLLVTAALFIGALYLADLAYVRGNYRVSLLVYKPLASLGIGSYQNRVASMYVSGRGVCKDFLEAARWYRKLAENGDTHAQQALGVLYLTRVPGLNDHNEAFEWFFRAASNGYKPAQAMVASMYSSGNGVTADKVQAYKWLLIASDGELSKSFADDILISFAEGMSQSQIAEAQELADEWMATHEGEL